MNYYIQNADQEDARGLATGLAIQKLNEEIAAVQQARTGGGAYTSNRAKLNYRLKESRTEETGREIFVYTISLTMGEEKPHVEDFFVSLVEEDATWKVSNYEYFK